MYIYLKLCFPVQKLYPTCFCSFDGSRFVSEAFKSLSEVLKLLNYIRLINLSHLFNIHIGVISINPFNYRTNIQLVPNTLQFAMV